MIVKISLLYIVKIKEEIIQHINTKNLIKEISKEKSLKMAKYSQKHNSNGIDQTQYIIIIHNLYYLINTKYPK
jgi:hypothetical protein